MNPAMQNWLFMQAAQNQGNPEGHGLDPNLMGMGGMGFAQGLPPAQYAGGAGEEEPNMPTMPMPNSAPRSKPTNGGAVEGANNDPIAKGAKRGLDVSRASLEMTDQQKRAALGQALMAWGANFVSNKNPTALGAAAEAFGPGLQQFNSAAAEAKGLNLDALNREDTLENREATRELAAAKMAEARAQHEFNRSLGLENLNLRKQGLELNKQKEKRMASEDGTTKMEITRDKHIATINRQLIDAQTDREKKIDSRVKRLGPMTGAKKAEAVAKIIAQVDKEAEPVMKNINKMMKKYNLDFNEVGAAESKDDLLVKRLITEHPEFQGQDPIELLKAAKKVYGDGNS